MTDKTRCVPKRIRKTPHKKEREEGAEQNGERREKCEFWNHTNRLNFCRQTGAHEIVKIKIIVRTER